MGSSSCWSTHLRHIYMWVRVGVHRQQSVLGPLRRWGAQWEEDGADRNCSQVLGPLWEQEAVHRCT